MRVSKMSSRIDMRADPQSKVNLEIAAFLGGYESLSKFMLEAAEDRANEILHNLENAPLSDEDRDMLLKLLDKSPAPNKNLKEAFFKVNASYKSIGNAVVQRVSSKLFKNINKD